MMMRRHERPEPKRTGSPVSFPRLPLLALAFLLGPVAGIQAEPPSQVPPPPPPQRPAHIQFNPAPQPPPGFVQPGQFQEPEMTEEMARDPYWRETVDRAVAEFESENPDVRRSAVMLLGKYPVEPARRVVGQALEDPDASVRQAALVSVLEEQGMINPAFSEKMLRLLADPNVSIRRIASNSVRSLIHSFPFGMPQGGVQIQRQISPEATRILQNAFRDDDVSVRRNMVTNYPFLQITLPEETVVALLHDRDREVAVHALRWGLSRLSPPTLSREIAELAQHEDDTFRLELARALQSQYSPAAVEALERLQNDPHAPVAIEAMLALFQNRQSIQMYERLVALYRESGRGSDAGQRIIFAAQMLGEDGRRFLREWLQHTNPALRQDAARIYLNRFGSDAETGFLLSLLNDSVQGIRQQAMRVLMQINERLSAEEIRLTMENRYPDVRQAAAGLVSLLPPEQSEDLLLDLLLDEVREVRLAALQQIGLRQIPGWEEIMSISLQVEDPVINRTALDWLIRHSTPEALRLLRAFRDENPRSPLRPQIEAHLRRFERGDPT